ncbi:MAG: rhodanese-like domain-containing protein [Betaproteobacteria bacterium]|nr:rhodanese-like domain-containing protein [Betaproteobacteria bacterium]
MEFFKQNVLLIGLVLGSGIMLLLPSFKRGAAGVASVSAAEAVALINRSNAFVLDVRAESEYVAGHILNAKNIPLDVLNDRLQEIKKYQNKPILVNCQRGVRSVKACEILRKAEFTQVSSLHGGLDAWVGAKLPVVRG